MNCHAFSVVVIVVVVLFTISDTRAQSSYLYVYYSVKKKTIFYDITSNYQPRMHSSRMRTVRWSVRLGAGGLPWGHVCLWGLPREGVCLGGVCPGECLPRGSAQGCLPRGCTPPPCGQTNTCKNITFLQLLLRTVKIWHPD